MNDAIARLDIGGSDVRAIDRNVSVGLFYPRGLAVDGVGGLPIADIFLAATALEYVVVEDGNQLGLVRGFEKAIELAGRKMLKRGVRRCKECERSRCAKRIFHAGKMQGTAERLQRVVRSCCIDEVV